MAEPPKPADLVLRILLTISFCHFLNDMIQSVIPAIYPILKTSFHLSFGQIGLITLTGQLTASLLQPVVGLYTDRHPQPFSLPVGMSFTLTGLVLLSSAGTFPALLVAVAICGLVLGVKIGPPAASLSLVLFLAPMVRGWFVFPSEARWRRAMAVRN